MNEPITHVLLDIEGTTCPVSFVSDTLFPYAARELGPYLLRRRDDDQVQALVEAVMEAWKLDPAPVAQQLLNSARERSSKRAEIEATAGSAIPHLNCELIVPYLQWLIAVDRKFTPLKELQGLVWHEGYTRGELIGTLFEEVPDTLKQWHQQGLVLGVYSSGSVAAQKLLYGHSQAGDLCPLFSHWFDTHIGSKQDANSYKCICEAMEAKPEQVLFVSDSETELQAASAANLQLAYSNRQDHQSSREPAIIEQTMRIKGVRHINNLAQIQPGTH